MPVISSFFGIYVRMYFADHGPPHVHVEYQGHEALVALDDGRVLAGSLPRRAARKPSWASGASTSGRRWRTIGSGHKPCCRWSASRVPTMIKLVEIDVLDDRRIRLRFSDGSHGICDFSPLIETRTAMTTPLADAGYFARAFIELGALAWPNGFDLSAESLRRRLEQAGALERRPAAA